MKVAFNVRAGNMCFWSEVWRSFNRTSKTVIFFLFKLAETRLWVLVFLAVLKTHWLPWAMFCSFVGLLSLYHFLYFNSQFDHPSNMRNNLF